MPLTYDGPRFGAVETPATPTTRRSGWALQVAKPLQQEPAHIQEWVLWREAVLEHLPPHVRQVPEAADIGLFAGLKHGITNPKNRKQLQQLWEKLSPLQEYEYYRYYPTVGFAFYDKVVDGTFLQKAIPWLETIRGGKHAPLSSATYTAALEKWMIEHQRKLTEAEVRYLKVLALNPSLSQKQLAKQLKITPGSLSIVIKRLASKHLLRAYCRLNTPLIGLTHVVSFLRFSHYETHLQMKQKLAKIRYAVLMRSIDSSLLMASFYIPSPHLEEFQTWMKKLCRTWELAPPSNHTVTDLVASINFQSYSPNVGWSSDFTSELELIHHIIRERVSELAPPLRSYKYSYESLTEKSSTLHLHPEDFVYFQRSIDCIEVTDTASSRVSREARQLGFSKLEQEAYRRRVGMLDKLGVQSKPSRIGILHIGLDAALYINIRSSRETTELVLRSLQLLPYQNGYIFNDSSALVTLLLPNPIAVEVFSSLRTLFAECGIYTRLAVKPAWHAFINIHYLITPENYDFENGEWLWLSNILPDPSN